MKQKAPLAVIIISALLFSAICGTFFVKPIQANPIINVYKDIPPPEGIQPPIVTIHTPTNSSSNPKNATLTFNVAIPKTGSGSISAVTKIYYKGNWEPNEITVAEKRLGSFSIDLSGAPGGSLSVTVYAVGVGYIQTEEEYSTENNIVYTYTYYDRFQMTGYSTVNFIKDNISPKITILSPTNKTYTTSDVELDFTVSEVASEILYCINGEENQSITGNITLSNLTAASHNVTLYTADLSGNAATPQTVFFDVDPPIITLSPSSLTTTQPNQTQATTPAFSASPFGSEDSNGGTNMALYIVVTSAVIIALISAVAIVLKKRM
jgi:hypothetical protein